MEVRRQCQSVPDLGTDEIPVSLCKSPPPGPRARGRQLNHALMEVRHTVLFLGIAHRWLWSRGHQSWTSNRLTYPCKRFLRIWKSYRPNPLAKLDVTRTRRASPGCATSPVNIMAAFASTVAVTTRRSTRYLRIDGRHDRRLPVPIGTKPRSSPQNEEGAGRLSRFTNKANRPR